VLLEVRGSLRLFGGVAGLRRALLSACAQLGLQAVLALAPLPRAALVAARAGRSLVIATRAELIGQLAPLPLAALRWPPEVIERLKRMGVRTVGEVLRLPRAGFARRFGVAQLACLDVVSGRTPEVRRAFRARERFRRRRELNYELQDHERLLHALGPLLEELEAFLRARQLGITQLECRFLHRAAAPSCCVVKLAAPAAAAAHLAALLKEQLARVPLPEPVRALELCADTLLAYVPQAQALWPPGEHGGGGGREAHGLIERLRARLGEESVYGLTLLEGHRPERTWALTAPPPVAATAPPAVAAAAASPRRPLWLLLEPQPLSERAGLPRRRGALRLLSEPERIESGWWDGADIARDYYTASGLPGRAPVGVPRAPRTARLVPARDIRVSAALTAATPAEPAYAELHCLSNFTFLRGASHPHELVQQALALGYRALALSDECSVAGVVRAHMAAKASPLKLLIGSEFRLSCGLKLVALAINRQGYARLCRLITRGRRQAKKGAYRLSRAEVAAAQLEQCFILWIPAAVPRAEELAWLAEPSSDGEPGRAAARRR
jgi:protein ImuB